MIAEDLAKLKDLDPVTWTNLRLQDVFELLDDDIVFERNRALDIIQGTIQRAIVSNGWHFALSAQGNGSMADITVFTPQCDIIDGPLQSSPAEAILAAYVAAKVANGVQA